MHINKNNFFLLFTLLISLWSLELSAQKGGIKEILNSGNSFEKIVNEADDYFKKKHPNKSVEELTKGIHRDGKFVKYQRWKHFWEHYQTENNQLADITAFHKKNEEGAQKLLNNYNFNFDWENISHTAHITGQIGMGRTTSLGFHPSNPNIFYVGAAIGGIWKTTNGGQSYTPIGDELPYLAVSSIIVDKNNPDIIYIALSDHLWYGPPGIGVYKSTDGGNSWAPTAFSMDFNENKRIYWMEADPNNSNKILVATEKGLYKTEDGFATVTQVNDVITKDVKFNLANNNIVYQVARDGKCLRSTDGGNSFSLLHTLEGEGGNVKILLTPQNTNKVAFSRDTVLYISTDSGISFSSTHSLPEDNSVNIIAPQNQNIIISGNNKIYRSDNNGSSFSEITSVLGQNGLPIVHVDQRNVFINSLQPDYIYICNDGGLYRYQVSNNNFTDLSDGLIITQFYDIAVSQTNFNIIGGGTQDNGSMFRMDNGQWDGYVSIGDGMNQEIDPINSNVRYFSSQYGNLFRWENGNSTLIRPSLELGSWETPYKIDPNNSNRLIAAYKKVYVSDNRGDDWTEISGELHPIVAIREIAIAPSNSNRIYASVYKSIFVKDANNNNWVEKSTPAPFGINDIEVSPNDMNTLYFTVPGYSAGNKVFKSTNAGNSWTNISGSIPNVPAGAIEIYENASGGLFVGTDAGIYYRDDSMTDWVLYGNLPHTRVSDIEIQYSAGLVRVGTHGRGVFQGPVPINGSLSLTQFIVVGNDPAVQANTLSAAVGESILLDFGGEFPDWTFTYTRPDGAQFPGGTNSVENDQITFNAEGGNLGTWQVEYTDPLGLTNSANFTINSTAEILTQFISVDNAPFVQTNTVNAVVGQSILLDFGGEFPNWEFTYTRPDGLQFPGSTNGVQNDQITFNAEDINFGTWQVHYTNPQGLTNSANFTIISKAEILTQYIAVINTPFVQSNTITVIEGEIIVLDFGGEFPDWEFSYTRPDGAQFPGGTNAAQNDQIIFSVQGTNVGTWQVDYTDPEGLMNSAEFIVNVTPPTETLSQFIAVGNAPFVQTNTVTVTEGRLIILDFGGEFPDWDFKYIRSDGAQFPGGTNGGQNDQIIFSAQGANAGTWQVDYTDPEGLMNSAEFTINVTPAAEMLTELIAVGNEPAVENYIVTVCEGLSILLDFEGEFPAWNFTYTRPDGAQFPGGTNGVQNDQITFNAQGVNVGTWDVAYTDPEGLMNWTDFTINVTPGSEPGSTCSDGDDNTENDIIGADGCSCQGTPIVTEGDLCDNLTIEANSTGIVVGGLNSAAISSVQVFTSSWQTEFSCFGDCAATTTVLVTPGTYFVYAKLYTSNYNLICEINETIIVTTEGNSCNNVTSGGAISSAQTICPNETAATLTNSSLPSGGSGNIEYLWLRSTVECPTLLSQEIPGANQATYSPSTLSQSTYYVRCSRRTGCSSWTQGKSNCVKITVDNTNCGDGPDTGGNGIDLAISLSGNGADVAPYTNFTVNLVVTNEGTQTANNVVVNITQPQNVVFQGGNSFSATQGNYDIFSTFNWSLGTIGAGQSATITLNYYALAGTPYTVYGQVQSMTAIDIDSTPGNGTNPNPNEDDEAVYVTGGGTPSCTLNLAATVSNIVCNDNGTPANDTDDTFTFDVLATGGSPWGWTGGGQSGDYSQVASYGTYNISAGNINFTIEDNNNTTCTTNVSVTAPSTCSVGNTNGGDGTTDDCSNISISQSGGNIILAGLDNAPLTAAWIFDASWNTVFSCSYGCGATETLLVDAGTYHIIVKKMNADWSVICEINETITISQLINNSGIQSNISNIDTHDLTNENDELRKESSTLKTEFIEFSAYPNPASDFIIIDLTNETYQSATLNLIDIFGRHVYSSSLNIKRLNSYKLDISQFTTGIYFLTIQGNNSLSISKQTILIK